MNKFIKIEHKTKLNVNNCVKDAITIEEKLAKLKRDGAPLEEGKIPGMYTEKRLGVLSEIDIRADKWMMRDEEFRPKRLDAQEKFEENKKAIEEQQKLIELGKKAGAESSDGN